MKGVLEPHTYTQTVNTNATKGYRPGKAAGNVTSGNRQLHVEHDTYCVEAGNKNLKTPMEMDLHKDERDTTARTEGKQNMPNRYNE